MKTVDLDLGSRCVTFQVPRQTEVLSIPAASPLPNPEACIEAALNNSIGSPGLDAVVKTKVDPNKKTRAVVVISDNTRPVPYKGTEGILWPIIQRLIRNGISPDRILILVATGTHRALSESELREMLDPRVFTHGNFHKEPRCLRTQRP